jgi:hypothetical protein
MPVKNNQQGDSFVKSLVAFKNLLDTHVFLDKGKDSFPFFRSKSALEKIAMTMIEVIEKITFSISFPAVSAEKKLFFLQRCDDVYRDLKNIIVMKLKIKHKMNAGLFEFSNQFSELIKSSLASLWSNEFPVNNAVNLNYLDYYVDAFSSGLDCPTNYSILRDEMLDLLRGYIATYPKSVFLSLVTPFFESIYYDNKGINQHTKNAEQRFFNLLKLMDMFRATLIDEKEDRLSSAITHLIDMALEIIRPHVITTFKQANEAGNIITTRLNNLEKHIEHRKSAELFFSL